MIQKSEDSLGPLKNGSTVAIIGGGPTGAACAIAIKNSAQSSGREVRVVLFEGKTFESHYNQCAFAAHSGNSRKRTHVGFSASFNFTRDRRLCTSYSQPLYHPDR